MVGGDSTIRGFIIRNSGSDLDRESCGLRVMGANTVIENNRFENVLFGIDLKQAPDCIIRHNVIGSMPLDEARRGDALRLFRSDRCLIEGNTIEDGRDALLWYSNGVTIRGNISRRNRYGFHMMFANDVTLEDNVLSDNSVGVYLMYGKGFVVRNNRIQRNRGPSGYGIGFKEVDQYEITGNLITGNCVAIYLDGSPLRRKPGGAFIRENTIACNDIGFSVLPAVKGNTIERNNLIDNIQQLAIQGRGTAQGNAITGNHWSDYAGYDLDGDGTGDQPYVSQKLFESLVDKEPRLRLMLFSPAHDAIELIARAMPAIAPQPRFTDERPLIAPIPMPLPAAPPSEPTLSAWAGVLLLIPVALLVLITRPRSTKARTEDEGFAAPTGVCP
jgi:nitrous oxidase accessory protein